MGLSVAHANGQLNRGAACRYTITSAAQGLQASTHGSRLKPLFIFEQTIQLNVFNFWQNQS